MHVFCFYKIAHWYQFLLLKYFFYYDCSRLIYDSSRLSLKMAFYFFMAKSYSILCIYDFFIHSSVHVHFSYFCVSAVNAAAVHACGHSCCCSVATSILQNGDCPHEMLNPLSPPSGCTQHPAFCEYGADCSRGLYEWTQTSFVLRVWFMSLSIMPSGFIHTVACVRTAFLLGWTTFIAWMDHGLLVHSSVEGHMEYLHSSLTSCNICGINFRKSHEPKVIHH